MSTTILLLTLIFPLVGTLINGFWGKHLSKKVSGTIATMAIAASFVTSCLFFAYIQGSQEPVKIVLFEWMKFNYFSIDFGFYFDQLAALWLLFITGIGTLIHLYSTSYMSHDENFSKFFTYLNFFVFFMLILVTGSNLAMMFIGWEGVGLCSYLLIGFWYKNQDYNNAAKKAFIMNRIGDLGFLVGIFVTGYLFHTLDFIELKEQSFLAPTLGIATMAFFIAATGKSAQLPLYTWLPDAMAGPTPVSALIHAATMVTAGIFMITRLNFLFDLTPDVQHIIAIIGAATALMAATIALVQNDIKKVLAYSTVSQLGLMFLALGLGAYEVAVFHVITHAFFKACLFLGSGSVIHAIGGEQDMRHMGGLKKHMKITYATFFIATIAISGFPPLSGFFSKDEILLTAFHHNIVLWVVASLASILTAFYMFRLLFLTFSNKFRGTEEQEHHLHESPSAMTMPLIILAVLAAVGGLISIPGNSWLNEFLKPVIKNNAASHPHVLGTTEYMLMGLAVVGALVGLMVAYFKYIKNKQVPVNDNNVSGLQKLFANKYYLDDIYQSLIVHPLNFFGSFFKNQIDGLINGIVLSFGRVPSELSYQGKKAQNGNIGLYLFAFVIGVCGLLYYLFMCY
ncbi:NADH-quinone oxidoreductase subunit L [Paenimyroides baculatum]|uniref:NADH-quinone oxidoreductase subunit L n=1 Tax=Paenimyroides baculatum TaxID=2608000 RepID=A0A5M6CZ32_9FLAO|nr:NADH-quinone oxidoreductase subunit L [Paenimyroides baculatum]KAA5538095.1 NADH-quinone oxidoreductase subunit L [Paenimyroides baculatum]